MEIYDVRKTCAGVDAQLAVIENPKHRHMLKNFRRHALLEVSGRWPEILIPEMIIEEPRYRLMDGGRSHYLNGMREVRAFYSMMAEAGSNVFGPLEEQVAVTDWGIFSEGRFANVQPGTSPLLQGDQVDPDGEYQITTWVAFAWPYLSGRLAGEHVYEDTNSRTVEQVPIGTLVTPSQARDRLTPLVDQTPLEEIVQGLELFR